MGKMVLIGAGSHGRVVLDILRALGLEGGVQGFVDAVKARESSLAGLPVLGGPEVLPELSQRGVDTVLVPIGEGRLREELTRRAEESGLAIASIVHPGAIVGGDVLIGPGAMVSAGAVLVTGSRLGKGVIVNTGATVDHDCTLGAFSHLCPGAHLGGNVVVGMRTMVGVGAAVRPGIRLGDDVTIGAGAAVVCDVPDGVTAVGVPARWTDSSTLRT